MTTVRSNLFRPAKSKTKDKYSRGIRPDQRVRIVILATAMAKKMAKAIIVAILMPRPVCGSATVQYIKL